MAGLGQEQPTEALAKERRRLKPRPAIIKSTTRNGLKQPEVTSF